VTDAHEVARTGNPPGEGQLADDFVSRVLSVVETIPEGRVMSYGDVAAAIGSRAARGVGQVMAYYGSDVPWWRVVRASGHPALDHEARALEYYRAESTPLRIATSGTYRVDMTQARWSPNGTESR
jgi:alkylated DNA nucleotide flippase Atl1